MRNMTTRFVTLTMALVFAIPIIASGQVVTVTDDISADVTWTAANTYILDGLIFVNDGATLSIEAGTVIKALEAVNITTGDDASALIVRRGGKINATGNVDNPIIFTSELDDVANPNDLDQRDRGLWGGIIIPGRATNNEPSLDTQIEGIAVEDEVAYYGGTDDDDNSGTLTYVSIRHGGFSISGVEGDEINGLTLGSVGRGTTIHHVEVFANFDDCYEWFGGTVEAKYLVGAFCGDDSYDYDQGFRGKGQFWFSIHDTDTAGRGGEHDGGDSSGDDAMPFSTPMISNVTYIGSGATATVSGGDNNDRTFAIRDNAGGMYYNSIFTDYPGTAMNIEDLGSGEDSRARLEAGDLMFNTNIWFGYGAGSTLADIIEGDFAETILAGTGNTIVDPMLAGISRTANGGLDPRPIAASSAHDGSVDTGDDWFEEVPYLGAFQHELWIRGWTALDALGFVGDLRVGLESIDSTVPNYVTLSQNYPNPFAGQTAVEFETTEAGRVRIALFDVLGREVALLHDNDVAAGTHRLSFEADNLPAGLYLYRMEAAGAVQSRSMTILK